MDLSLFRGQSEFDLTKDMVKFPKSTLEAWVKASYTDGHLNQKVMTKDKRLKKVK